MFIDNLNSILFSNDNSECAPIFREMSCTTVVCGTHLKQYAKKKGFPDYIKVYKQP